MKNIIFNIIIASFIISTFVACEKETFAPIDTEVFQVEQSGSCDQTDAVKNLYMEDASWLAIQLAAFDAVPNNSISIPEDDYTTAMNALMAIYNATDIPARDSVFNIYDIHATPTTTLDRLLIGVDDSFEWVQALAEGNTTTGNATIDNLMATYELEVVEYSSMLKFAAIKSNKPLNIDLLATVFADINGVTYTEKEPTVGEGNNIDIRPTEAGMEVTFSVGYGDCPSGCISNRYWSFTVEPGCNVTYNGSYGDPAP